MKVRSDRLRPSVVRAIVSSYAAALVAIATSTALAAGVVGSGTADSCTDAALDTALADGGMVTFDCGTDPVTIDISTGTGTKTITADTTIDGESLITISGGNVAEVFVIPHAVNFTLQNLTVTNGRLVGNDGGGIANDSGTLTVTNCTFTGNSAFDGGGIYNNGGTLTVANSTFGTNTGGGIFSVGGSLTVSDSTFTDNVGYGISSLDASLTVTNSTFTGNSADGGVVGGIVNLGGTLTVANSTFAGNSSYQVGGGIINDGSMIGDGPLTVTNSTFTGAASRATPTPGAGPTPKPNSASTGGGIFSANAPLTITNSTFTGNSADYGGGIFSANAPLTITNSTFTGNSAGYGGGISWSFGTLTVTNSTIAGNSATNGGGGIYAVPPCDASPCPSLNLVLRSTIVANNTGDNCSPHIIIDDGHNIEDGTSCGFSTGKGSLSNTDPQLDPAGLQDNGGPTQTVALCTGVDEPAGCSAASPAIGTGDQAACRLVSNLDQRGFARPGAGHAQCSIGAYEPDATAPQGCVGDCNDSSGVTIDELVRGVNMLLSDAPPDQCQAFDCNGTGHVTVDCLVRAVNSVFNGCGVVCSSAGVCDGTPGSG